MVSARVVFGGIIFLFTFIISSIMGVLISTALINGFIASGMFGTAALSAANTFLGVLGYFDKIAVLLMILLIVGVGVSSFRLASHPVFFVIVFFMGALFGLVSYIFNYMFIQFIGQTVFNTVEASFPASILIATNLHWVSLAMVVVGSITLFAKKPKGQFLT